MSKRSEFCFRYLPKIASELPLQEVFDGICGRVLGEGAESDGGEMGQGGH